MSEGVTYRLREPANCVSRSVAYTDSETRPTVCQGEYLTGTVSGDFQPLVFALSILLGPQINGLNQRRELFPLLIYSNYEYVLHFCY